MSIYAEPTTTAQSTDHRLAVMLDRAEISELVDRYIITLDTAEEESRDIEWYRRIFTDDIRLIFPIKEEHGVVNLPEFHKQAKMAWQAIHHVSANHLIDLDGDRAQVRVHLIGTHVEHDMSTMGVDSAHKMDMGGCYEVDAVRTPRGWRISFLRFDLTWTSGGGSPRPRPHAVRKTND